MLKSASWMLNLKSHKKTKNLFLKILLAEWKFFASVKIGISLEKITFH